uniref:4'-phosphopantetheinyl transferase superfamily protein n=1 Tax=Paenibacillus xylanexedens TaxID=528191 RepID=UPI0011A0BF3B|nr:4'-phosphopantetheinyl transferase superfamily protein [Paenibacillus xylanexedens]
MEKIERMEMKIGEQFFSVRERIFVGGEGGEMEVDRLYGVWRVKESYMKGVGMGLWIGVD